MRARLQEITRPDITENELWATFGAINAALGGDYVETRLLVAGPRTNPWYTEAGAREGVKLEEMVRITETGCELVANYPFEDELPG